MFFSLFLPTPHYPGISDAFSEANNFQNESHFSHTVDQPGCLECGFQKTVPVIGIVCYKLVFKQKSFFLPGIEPDPLPILSNQTDSATTNLAEFY